jgi:hypothetical protein
MIAPEAGTFTTAMADGKEVAFTRDDDGAITVLTTRIPLVGICIDGGTQSRVSLHEPTTVEYTEFVRNGGQLPAVVVFVEGAEVWLADGFHRFQAHRAADVDTILCEVHFGTRRDAVLYSAGANVSHGLRRTNEDKRCAVMMLLNDPEWSAQGIRWIARQCAVSEGFVHKLYHADASVHGEQIEKPTARTVTRNGTTYEQNTANIGKPAAAPPVQTPAAPSAAVTQAATVPALTETAPSPAPEAAQPATTSAGTDEVEVLHEQIDELSELLKSTSADNEMMGRVFDADDQIKAAMDEAKRQKAIAENLKRTLDAKSGEFIARAGQVTYWMNRAKKEKKRADKLEKELARLAAS